MTPWKLKYAGGDLDRAGVARKDAAWLARMRRSPEALCVPMMGAETLLDLRDEQRPAAVYVAGDAAVELLGRCSEAVFLGLRGEVPYFAIALEDADANAIAAEGHAFVDIRRLGPLLDDADAALLAHARGMLGWHAQHRFCARCGAPAEFASGGHVRRCTAEGCGRESYPRTDPAVIMLVTLPASGDQPARCLLGRDQRFPPGVFSTLAGFVEPGESLEEAVAREVFEETAVRVGEVRYRASQPWPFPSSIMLGFEADAVSDAITIDPDEIAEAHWFVADELRTFGEWTDDSAARRLPRRDSIARQLIDDWLARHT